MVIDKAAETLLFYRQQPCLLIIFTLEIGYGIRSRASAFVKFEIWFIRVPAR